jgi:hypothetical protein
MGPFLKEVARIAREDGEPLRPELEQRLARRELLAPAWLSYHLPIQLR